MVNSFSMELIRSDQLPFSSPSELLAGEEALLDHCEANPHPGFLTFWESTTYFVVLGYGKNLSAEVFETVCLAEGIPILRRTSGGGTVLQGPGCLNYTLVLPLQNTAELETITGTNRFVMEKNRLALAQLTHRNVQIAGHTDLTLDGLKFSGNAQRRKRRCLLFHGSLLLNFDLDRISRTLRPPPLQPEYRANRPHEEFLTNCDLEAHAVKAAFAQTWKATASTDAAIVGEIVLRAEELAASKYAHAEWNRRM